VPYPLKKLRRILTSFGAWEDSSRGKGSHTVFFRDVDGSVFSFPIPTHDKEVKDCYLRGVRKRLRLSTKDGITDDEFFGRA
jgi:hypothetical protein